MLDKEVSSKSASILFPGCGNSHLGEQLSKEGYENLLAVDYVPEIIEKMTEIGRNNNSKVQYRTMDMLDMKELQSESFDVVLDKGSLDALYSREEMLEKVTQYFQEVLRVLAKKGGLFLCVSLLQEHINLVLIDFWMRGNLRTFTGANSEQDYMVESRLYRLEHDMAGHVPFAFAFKVTAFEKSNEKLASFQQSLQGMCSLFTLEAGHIPKMPEVTKRDNLVDRVQAEQLHLVRGRRYEMFIYAKEGKTDTPRFTFYVVDTENEQQANKQSYLIKYISLFF